MNIPLDPDKLREEIDRRGAEPYLDKDKPFIEAAIGYLFLAVHHENEGPDPSNWDYVF